ncbi:MAG: NPCBM/NEW2 domain-containing protein [Emticicia sp.]|uniref:NPCBM/NEW2 domain-containing protein n=1 Tax=Emticicia sp. TaxID=1930953 RepID=UPI003BA77F5E
MKFNNPLITLFALISFYSTGQISITFPMEKAVFQRSATNNATINIAGNYSTSINSVEARFINALNSQVIIDWTTFTTNINGGIFSGSVSNVPGGWYTLEIRGKLNGNIVGSTTLNRVGVGEVFLIAGQSNAQGLEGNQAEVGASDERVLSHNQLSWYDNNINQCDKKVPNYPTFSQIFSDGSSRSYVSKTGFNPWCYGKLGDNLVAKLGVPVVFFNAAAVASSSLNWKESSDGLTTYSHFNQQAYCNTSGVPYAGFERVLNYYASVFGVRAVLWHQGETDNYAQITESNYVSNVSNIINKSRNEIGNVPWVISRVSVFDKNANGGAGNSNSSIINAQNSLINSSNKIYPGPSTDDILGSNRSDEVHFFGPGLIELANRWNAALSIDFFNDATPITPKAFPQVTVGCQSVNEIRLTAPAGYSSYKWVRVDTGNEDYEDATESTSQVIDRNSGTYRCYLTDNQGNITFTQPITVQNVASQCSCVGLTSCTGVTFLSDTQFCSSSNGWGPIELDKSNGENGAGDGTTLRIRGVAYSKGLGVHANSTISYKLNNNFGRFIALLGIDDEVATSNVGTTVIFKVYKDNTLAYTSAVLDRNSAVVKININVAGVNELRLEVDDAGDNNFADHANWASARLHCVDTQAPSAPTALSESLLSQNCVTLNWNASTDNMEVEKYNIYRDGSLIATVEAPITTYRVTGLNQLNYYTFIVKAVDYSGNESNQSNLLEVVTLQNTTISNPNKIINKGQSSTLTAFGCFGGTVTWSNGATSSSITVSPTDTTIYSVTCKIGNCTSAATRDTVKVIPDCKPNYTLLKNRDDLSGASTLLTFNASQTINAANSISLSAKVDYNAAKSVTLLPGFSTSSGTVFNAKIAGCPNTQSVILRPSDTFEVIPKIETKISSPVSKTQ